MTVTIKTKPFTDVEDVKRAVARYFRVTVTQLESASKRPCFAHPRQVAMALSYRRLRKLGFTMEAIGAAFGNRHYSTVVFACRKFGIEPSPDHPATRMSARRAKASVPMRPCKPPQPRPQVEAMTRQRTPEEVRRAYWMKQAGFMRAA